MSINQFYVRTLGLFGTLALSGALLGTVSAAVLEDPTLTIVTDNITQSTARGNVVTLTGRTAIGALAEPAHLLYVVDVSRGAVAGSGPGQDCNVDGNVTAQDDFNRDTAVGDTLDCEISAINALHQQLSARTVVSNGLLLWAGSALIADVDPQPDHQMFTRLDADHNHNGLADLTEVLQTITAESVQNVTSGTVSEEMNLDNALQTIQQAFALVPSGQKIAFLLATNDTGLHTEPDSPLAALSQAGVTVNTYAIGAATLGCQRGTNLRLIADQTGGRCTPVAMPGELPTTLVTAKPKGIVQVKVQVDQQEPQLATLDALGNWWLDIPVCNGIPMYTQATAMATDGTAASADYTLCGPPVLPPDPEPTRPAVKKKLTFFPLIATYSEPNELIR